LKAQPHLTAPDLPLVSVLIPAWNAEKFIQQAITSVLKQSIKNFELIIVNDGSTDGTAALLDSLTDPRIRVFHFSKNRGLIAALNFAISKAKGQLISRLDSDDWVSPEHLANALRAFEAKPEVSCVFSDVRMVDIEGKDNQEPHNYTARSFEECKKVLPFRNCLVGASMVMRAEVARRFGFRPEADGLEDYDLWVRLVATGHVFEILLNQTYFYRYRPDSVSHSIEQGKRSRAGLRARIHAVVVGIKNGKFGRFHIALIYAAAALTLDALKRKLMRLRA